MNFQQSTSIFLLCILFFVNACTSESNIEEPSIPDEPTDEIVDSEYDKTFVSCLIGEESKELLEVVTWNIEHFPKHSETVKFVSGTIANSVYDLWGIQEVEQTSELRKIATLDPRYSVLIDEDISKGINNNYHLAYVYNNEYLEVLDQKMLTTGEFERYYFPRRPLWVKFKNKINNEEFIVINLHLKAFGDEESKARRFEAGNILKRFIESEHDNDKVIVLGDYNTVIAPISDSDMSSFLADSINYKFSDQLLANSNDPTFWSYPNWPSHIDHILMTNEFFNQFVEAVTLPLDQCSENYDPTVSDHRPVMSTFQNN